MTVIYTIIHFILCISQFSPYVIYKAELLEWDFLICLFKCVYFHL